MLFMKLEDLTGKTEVVIFPNLLERNPKALEENKNSNVTKGNVHDMGSKDSLMYNLEEGKLLVTIGLNGFVVVNTPDVVAVFRKEDNTKLKDLLKGFENNELSKYL